MYTTKYIDNNIRWNTLDNNIIMLLYYYNIQK